MKITTSYSTGRTETGVLRYLDGERRTLVIMAPWGQSVDQTIAAIWDQLTEDEQREVAQAFGLDRPGGAA
jgi:hypothetical protein